MRLSTLTGDVLSRSHLAELPAERRIQKSGQTIGHRPLDVPEQDDVRGLRVIRRSARGVPFENAALREVSNAT
jgi:hypothetical protein